MEVRGQLHVSSSSVFLHWFLSQCFSLNLELICLLQKNQLTSEPLGIHLPIPVFRISVTCCSSFYVGARDLNSCSYVCIANISSMGHLSSPCWYFLFLFWNLREMIHTTLPIYILINSSKIWKHTHIPQTYDPPASPS